MDSEHALSTQLSSILGLTGIKHLVAAIDRNREKINASNSDLVKLFAQARTGRSRFADDTMIGQEELYIAIDDVLNQLWNYKQYSRPFHVKVKTSEAPDYYHIIKHPMDLSKMKKKLSQRQYKSKQDFAADLELIWDNCRTYNPPESWYYMAANQMQSLSDELLRGVPEIAIKSKEEWEQSVDVPGTPLVPSDNNMVEGIIRNDTVGPPVKKRKIDTEKIEMNKGDVPEKQQHILDRSTLKVDTFMNGISVDQSMKDKVQDVVRADTETNDQLLYLWRMCSRSYRRQISVTIL